MSTTQTSAAKTAPKPATSSTGGLVLQRKCACGGSAGLTGDCEDCREKKLLGKPLQKKLAINEPGDEYEREADRVAEQVLRMPASAQAVVETPRAPLVQRRTSGAPSASGAHAPAIVHDVLSSSGEPLDLATRSYFEPRFGHDFANVRIHSDARAAESARSVNALAYTVGDHVVFGHGQNWRGNHHLLAHELTHVVQQTGAPTVPAHVSGRPVISGSARRVARAPAPRPTSDRARLPAVVANPTPSTAVDDAVRLLEMVRFVPPDRYAIEIDGQSFFMHHKPYEDLRASIRAQIVGAINRQRGFARAVEAEYARVRDLNESYWSLGAIMRSVQGVEVPADELARAFAGARLHLENAESAWEDDDIGAVLKELELSAEQSIAADEIVADYKAQLYGASERIYATTSTVRNVAMGILVGIGAILILPEAIAVAGLVGGSLLVVGGGVAAGGAVEGSVSLGEELVDGDGVDWSKVRGRTYEGGARAGQAALSSVVGGLVAQGVGRATTLAGAVWRGSLIGGSSSSAGAAFGGIAEGKSSREIVGDTLTAGLEGTLAGPFGGTAGFLGEEKALLARAALGAGGDFVGSGLAALAVGKPPEEALTSAVAEAIGGTATELGTTSRVGDRDSPTLDNAPVTREAKAPDRATPDAQRAEPAPPRITGSRIDDSPAASTESRANEGARDVDTSAPVPDRRSTSDSSRPDGTGARANEGLVPTDHAEAVGQDARTLDDAGVDSDVALSVPRSWTTPNNEVTWAERAIEARWVDAHPGVIRRIGAELRARIGQTGEHEIIAERGPVCRRHSPNPVDAPCPARFLAFYSFFAQHGALKFMVYRSGDAIRVIIRDAGSDSMSVREARATMTRAATEIRKFIDVESVRPKIDVLSISHFHRDHINWVGLLNEYFEIATIETTSRQQDVAQGKTPIGKNKKKRASTSPGKRVEGDSDALGFVQTSVADLLQATREQTQTPIEVAGDQYRAQHGTDGSSYAYVVPNVAAHSGSPADLASTAYLDEFTTEGEARVRFVDFGDLHIGPITEFAKGESTPDSLHNKLINAPGVSEKSAPIAVTYWSIGHHFKAGFLSSKMLVHGSGNADSDSIDPTALEFVKQMSRYAASGGDHIATMSLEHTEKTERPVVNLLATYLFQAMGYEVQPLYELGALHVDSKLEQRRMGLDGRPRSDAADSKERSVEQSATASSPDRLPWESVYPKRAVLRDLHVAIARLDAGDPRRAQLELLRDSYVTTVFRTLSDYTSLTFVPPGSATGERAQGSRAGMDVSSPSELENAGVGGDPMPRDRSALTRMEAEIDEVLKALDTASTSPAAKGGDPS